MPEAHVDISGIELELRFTTPVLPSPAAMMLAWAAHAPPRHGHMLRQRVRHAAVLRLPVEERWRISCHAHQTATPSPAESRIPVSRSRMVSEERHGSPILALRAGTLLPPRVAQLPTEAAPHVTLFRRYIRLVACFSLHRPPNVIEVCLARAAARQVRR